MMPTEITVLNWINRLEAYLSCFVSVFIILEIISPCFLQVDFKVAKYSLSADLKYALFAYNVKPVSSNHQMKVHFWKKI